MDTNNGTEAQNKILKYKYMPKTRASTLSALVTLLVERFLPDAQQRYVLPNVKASDWYRTYNNFVPAYLRDRPRSVVLHCMNQQSRGNKYTDNDLSLGEGEGIFLIQKKDGSQQVVNFGKNSQDKMKWHLPCKHFFAVFKLKEAWDWNALPAKYLNSAYHSVDIQSIPSTVNVPNSDVESTVEIPNSDVESTVEIPNQATLLQQPIPVKVINYNNYDVINLVMTLYNGPYSIIKFQITHNRAQ